jgi:hypothetical protein
MAQIDDARAQLVAEGAEKIYRALLQVQPILREALASDPSIGTSRPNRDAEKRSDLGTSFRVSSFDDTVVIGFWWSGQRPRFVCSGRGLNLLNANPLLSRTIDVGNKPHAKDAEAAYQEFLVASRDMHRIDPTLAMDQLNRMFRICYRGDRNAQAFAVTEAEARFFAVLMQDRQLIPNKQSVPEEVHLYGTHSPCSGCCQTFTRLAGLKIMYDNIKANPIAHSGIQFTDFRRDYEAAGFDRWKIGGLYYGRLYDGSKRTDLRLLEQAKSDQGIGWFKQIPVIPRG